MLPLSLAVLTCAPAGQLKDATRSGACLPAGFDVRPSRCDADPVPAAPAPELGHDWLRDRPMEPPTRGDLDPPAMRGTPIPEPLEPGLPDSAS